MPRSTQDFGIVYYAFQEELRQKFAKILTIDIPPDFALIPNTTIEKGGKRAHNDGTYILFRIEDGKPKVLKDSTGKWRRKRPQTDRLYLWDTPEPGGLFHKKGSIPNHNPPLT